MNVIIIKKMKIVNIVRISFLLLIAVTFSLSYKSNIKIILGLKINTAVKAEPAVAATPAAAAPAAPAAKAAPAVPAAPAAPATPAAGAAAGAAKGGAAAASSSLTNTNVIGGKPNSTNAIGVIGPAANYTIATAPYVIKSCEQILIFPAEILTDFNDYTKKKPAFFTLSMYFFNMFDSATSSKLALSILIDNIKQLPFFLKGSKSCLNINDAKNRKTVGLCLADKDSMKDIIKVFQDFLRCRGGDDLKPISVETIKNLVLNNCTEKIDNITVANPNLVIELLT